MTKNLISEMSWPELQQVAEEKDTAIILQAIAVLEALQPLEQ